MLTLTLWSHLRTLMVRINQKGIIAWSLKCVILSVFLNAAYVVTRMAWKIQISGQLGAGHDMWLAEDAPDMSWYYITNETVGRVCYYQLISSKSYSPITGNFSDLLKSSHFLYRRCSAKIFSDLQNFSTRNSPSVLPYLVKLNDNGSYHGLREPIGKLENHYPELKIY